MPERKRRPRFMSEFESAVHAALRKLGLPKQDVKSADNLKDIYTDIKTHKGYESAVRFLFLLLSATPDRKSSATTWQEQDALNEIRTWLEAMTEGIAVGMLFSRELKTPKPPSLPDRDTHPESR
jgi:hypothetical protein